MVALCMGSFSLWRRMVASPSLDLGKGKGEKEGAEKPGVIER